MGLTVKRVGLFVVYTVVVLGIVSGIVFFNSPEAADARPGMPRCEIGNRQQLTFDFLSCDSRTGWHAVHFITGIAIWQFLPAVLPAGFVLMAGEVTEWVFFIMLAQVVALTGDVVNESFADSYMGDIMIQGVWGVTLGVLIHYICNGPHVYPVAAITGASEATTLRTVPRILGLKSITFGLAFYAVTAVGAQHTATLNYGIIIIWGVHGVMLFIIAPRLWTTSNVEAALVWHVPLGTMPTLWHRMRYYLLWFGAETLILAHGLNIVYMFDNAWMQSWFWQAILTALIGGGAFVVYLQRRAAGRGVVVHKRPVAPWTPRPLARRVPCPVRWSTWAALGTFALMCYIMALVQVLTDWRADDSVPVLRDVMLDKSSWYIDSPLLVGIIIAAGAAVTFIMVLGWNRRPQLVFRRVLWIMSMLYALRTITIPVTQFPNPFPSCTSNSGNAAAQPLLSALLIVTGQHVTCSDLMFSGHTVVLVTLAYVWIVYTEHWVLRAAGIVYAGTGIVFVLLTRLHYTADVIIGVLMAMGVHQLYYWAVALGKMVQSVPHVHHSWAVGTWLIVAVRVLDDSDVPDIRAPPEEHPSLGAYTPTDLKKFVLAGSGPRTVYYDRMPVATTPVDATMSTTSRRAVTDGRPPASTSTDARRIHYPLQPSVG